MPELPELPELLALRADVERSTVPPAFEPITRRARARRRRRRIIIVAAGCVVLAGGVALVPGDGAGPPPPSTGPTIGPPSGPTSGPTTDRDDATPARMNADQIITSGRLRSYAYNPGGLALSVWQSCTGDGAQCRSAWQVTHDAEPVTRAKIRRGSAETYAAGDHFVLVPERGMPQLVVGGDPVTLEIGDPPLPVGAGDVAVPKGLGWLVVDPTNGKASSLAPPGDSQRLAQAAIAADGTVWALPIDQTGQTVTIAWDPGDGWHRHVIAEGGTPIHVPGALAVAGTRIAAFATSDGATIMPVGTLAVSTDAGASWTELHRADLPFTEIDSLAATRTGTLYVAEPSGRLWRSADDTWTRFAPVTAPGPVSALRPAGNQVVGVTGGDKPVLTLFDHDETTEVRLR